MEILIPIVVVVALAFAALGTWIASQKNRDGGEGFILGLLFGPIGVIIEAVLPTVAQPPPPAPAAELTEEEQDRIQEQRRRQAAQEEAKRLAAARELEERRKARIEQMRREKRGKGSDARGKRKRNSSRSIKALWRWIPDWVKMASAGLLLGLVLCTPLFIYWPKPFTPPPDGEPEINRPRLGVIPPPQPSATGAPKSRLAPSSESARTPNLSSDDFHDFREVHTNPESFDTAKEVWSSFQSWRSCGSVRRGLGRRSCRQGPRCAESVHAGCALEASNVTTRPPPRASGGA